MILGFLRFSLHNSVICRFGGIIDLQCPVSQRGELPAAEFVKKNTEYILRIFIINLISLRLRRRTQ